MKHLTGNLLAAVVLATTVRGQERGADWSLPHETGAIEASFPSDPEMGERYYRARLTVPA
jgi:hypothetical protein